MADLRTKKIDDKQIQHGGWVGEEYGTPIPGWDDLCLRVRGYDSAAYRLARAVKMKSLKEENYEQGELKPEVGDRLFRETLDETILLEWKNLNDGKKPFPHSKEAQASLILDPDNKPLRDAIDYAAIVIGNQRKKVEEKIEKN